MAHQLVFMPQGNDDSSLFKRHLDVSGDANDEESTGITSPVLSPAIHIVPPRYDNARDSTNPESLRRKRRAAGDDHDDTTTACDSSDTLLDEDAEMRDDTTYDCDELEEDENVFESVVELCKTGELVGAHVPEYWQRKNHLVRLWQSIASRIDQRDAPTLPLRYLAGWTNESRKRGDHLAQKRRALHVSSGSSIGDERFWAGKSKRRRSSGADGTVDMAISNDDYIASKSSHWQSNMSSCDMRRSSPLRNNADSGLPRYYPGGWPTPPSENDETTDNDEADEDGARDSGNDDCDLLISSELALDAQVMGPSVSEYFTLDSDDRSLEVAAVTPESEDEYDDEDAEYFHDFGSLLQSLRDVAKGCTSSVGSPSSSTGFPSSKRPPVIFIDYDGSSTKKDDNSRTIIDDDDDDDDDIARGTGVDYDDCKLAPDFDDESMKGENDEFELVARDDSSLLMSIEG
ncbi:hypothetical protein V1509DRAFT_625970 [Lipomyces kononenkoae]